MKNSLGFEFLGYKYFKRTLRLGDLKIWFMVQWQPPLSVCVGAESHPSLIQWRAGREVAESSGNGKVKLITQVDSRDARHSLHAIKAQLVNRP